MSKLIYITNTSLDGYIEDAAGNFDWPSSAETYTFFTELLRQMGTLIYGRRLYEKMAYWGSPVEIYPQDTTPSLRFGSDPSSRSTLEPCPWSRLQIRG